MATDEYDDKIFHGDVTFTSVTFEGDVPNFSLEGLDSLDISGSIIAAGSGQFGTTLSVGSNLTVTGDATINGGASIANSLSVGENLSCANELAVTGAATLGNTLGVMGAVTCSSTLAVTGAATLSSTLAATGAVTCSSTLAVTGAATLSNNLAVAGTSALHGTAITGTLTVSSTLGVTGATTMAAASCTTLAASSNASVGGTLGVTGATTLGAATVGTSLTVTGATIVGKDEYVTLDVANLHGTGVYGLASPVAGTLVKIQSRLKAALATGDAVVTGKIGNTAITNGAFTVTQSLSAAGDIDVANPTAQNTVVVGSDINFTVSGTNTADVGCTLTLTFLRSA